MTPSKAFFVALTVIAACDLTRALLPATEVDDDDLVPGFFYRHVKLIGLPHLESASSYVMQIHRSATFHDL